MSEALERIAIALETANTIAFADHIIRSRHALRQAAVSPDPGISFWRGPDDEPAYRKLIGDIETRMTLVNADPSLVWLGEPGNRQVVRALRADYWADVEPAEQDHWYFTIYRQGTHESILRAVAPSETEAKQAVADWRP